MDTKDIEKFLIKIELNSDAYITGEFLYRTSTQLQLLNSMYKAGDKVVLPSVTLSVCDIKSVVRLNETEIEAYMSVIKEKNMIEECLKCTKKEDQDEYSGIKTIDEGFESIYEGSSEESTLNLGQDKESEIYESESSSDETSSCVSEEENLKEAFARKLAALNSAKISNVVSKEVVVKEEEIIVKTEALNIKEEVKIIEEIKKEPEISGWTIPDQLQKDVFNLQIDNQKNITEKKFNKIPYDFDKRQNRRRDGFQYKRENVDRKTFQSKTALSKGTIVYGWKEKKYKNGFEILKAMSSNFDNKYEQQKEWKGFQGVELGEGGKKLYHEKFRRNKK